MKARNKYVLIAFCLSLLSFPLRAQHNYELNNVGASITVQSGGSIYVWGDVHMSDNGSGGTLNNNGLIEVQGNWHSDDNAYQHRGTGTVRFENNDVNTSEAQFIQGSNAVRGGQSQIGVDDGSFYNLELANTQGLVYLNGAGSDADVRGRVDFAPSGATGSPPVNRLRTDNADMGNGSDYRSIFGLMNPVAGLSNLLKNTITTNGNVSSVDNGYIQGHFRRAISPTGGIYGFPLGLEPSASATAARGIQYVHLDLGANNYDVISGIFEQGEPNTVSGSPEQCSYQIDCFAGSAHGEWKFKDISGSGAGTYETQIWPQDYSGCSNTVYVITKDNALGGNEGECGATPIGLTRGGYNGFSSPFSEFSFAGGTVSLPVKWLDFSANLKDNLVQLEWSAVILENADRFEVERSADNQIWKNIGEKRITEGIGEVRGYEFWDELPGGETWFYRLRQVDLNASFQYSSVVSVHIDTKWHISSDYRLRENDLQLSVYSTQVVQLDLILLNALGQRVYANPLTLNKGKTMHSVDTQTLSSGIYYLNLSSDDYAETFKLLIP